MIHIRREVGDEVIQGENMTAIPENVMDVVDRTRENLDQLETLLVQFISSCDADMLAEMSPLEHAQSLFSLAKASSILFTLRLRSAGIDPDVHLFKTELDRLDLYEEKLERYANCSKARAQPSATLNYQAAARFIGHSITNLTSEQKKHLRDISEGAKEGSKAYCASNGHKKRKKRASCELLRPKEFLQKAAHELLGPKYIFKGPIQMDSFSTDNLPRPSPSIS